MPRNNLQNSTFNEKKEAWLFRVGDEILPSYVGMKKPMTHTIHVWHMHIWLIFMVGTVNVPYMNAMGNELHYEDA